jgi:hypothetical protein
MPSYIKCPILNITSDMAFLGEDIQNGGPRWILMRGLDLMRGRLDDVRQFLANAAHIRFGYVPHSLRSLTGKEPRKWRDEADARGPESRDSPI